MNPGVSLTKDGIPDGVWTFLTNIVGSVLTVGLILAVLTMGVGAIGWGLMSLSNRPGVAATFVKVLAVSAGVAILCAGANAAISYFAGIGTSIFL